MQGLTARSFVGSEREVGELTLHPAGKLPCTVQRNYGYWCGNRLTEPVYSKIEALNEHLFSFYLLDDETQIVRSL